MFASIKYFSTQRAAAARLREFAVLSLAEQTPRPVLSAVGQLSLPEKIEHTHAQRICHRFDLIVQNVAFLIFDPANSRAIKIDAAGRQATGHVFKCDSRILREPRAPDAASDQIFRFDGGGFLHELTGGFHPLTIAAFLFGCGWTSPMLRTLFFRSAPSSAIGVTSHRAAAPRQSFCQVLFRYPLSFNRCRSGASPS